MDSNEKGGSNSRKVTVKTALAVNVTMDKKYQLMQPGYIYVINIAISNALQKNKLIKKIC